MGRQDRKPVREVNAIAAEFGFSFAGWTGSNGVKYEDAAHRVVYTHPASPSDWRTLANIRRRFRLVAGRPPQVSREKGAGAEPKQGGSTRGKRR